MTAAQGREPPLASGFTVAAIVREPLPVLRRFVGWYRGQGAAQIWLYFDDPEDPARAEFAATPGLRAIPCDAAFWRALGLDAQVRFTRRQNVALTAAYHRAETAWFLNVDADELMHVEGRTLAEAVAAFDPAQRSIRVTTAEQVLLPSGETAFRTPIPRAEVDRVYAADTGMFRQRFGLISHPEGKSFHRVGQTGIRLRQHWAHDADGTQIEAQILGLAENAYLLHFAAPDYETWRRKLDWRFGSHGFSARMKAALQDRLTMSDDLEQAHRALYQSMHCLTPDQAARLEATGGLLRLPEFTYGGQDTTKPMNPHPRQQ